MDHLSFQRASRKKDGPTECGAGEDGDGGRKRRAVRREKERELNGRTSDSRVPQTKLYVSRDEDLGAPEGRSASYST